MGPSAPAPYGVAPQRTPVVFDPATSDLRIGPYERHVEDPAEPTQVYSAYLSLLYAVRGARPGERLALRSADLEALLLIVGDDPATIEQRLVGLMGCSTEEASVLGGLLLRHRRMTATLGIAATLSLGPAGVLSTGSGDEPADRPGTARAVAAPPAVHDPAPAAPTPISGLSTPAPAQVAPLTPVTAVVVGPPTTSTTGSVPAVVEPEVEFAEPVAPEPVVVPVAAPAPVVAPVVAPPPAPVVAVEQEPAYALPTYALPVMDAPPPPVEVEVPDSAIGEPAVIDGPLEEIGGVVDSGHESVEPPLTDDADVGEPAVLDAPVELAEVVAPTSDR